MPTYLPLISLALSVVAILISGVSLYLNFYWRPERLILTISGQKLVDSAPFGSFYVTLVFTNLGKQAVYIEQVALIQTGGEGGGLAARHEWEPLVRAGLHIFTGETHIKAGSSDRTIVNLYPATIVLIDTEKEDDPKMVVAPNDTGTMLLTFQILFKVPKTKASALSFAIKFLDKRGESRMKIVPAWDGAKGDLTREAPIVARLLPYRQSAEIR